MFKVLYKKILWLEYQERLINNFNWNILRRDSVYEILTKKYFYNKIASQKIMLILERINLKTSTELALLVYIYALNNKWSKALIIMEKVVYLEKWENIDSFIDYWHFLRKNKNYYGLSNRLLLNIEKVMCLYKKEYFNWKKSSIINLLNSNNL